MKGININCKEYDFVQMILDGKKIIETRRNESLLPYVGKRVGLVETGKGRAVLRGYATVITEWMYGSVDVFRSDEGRHRVPEGSKYDMREGDEFMMYGYEFADVVPCKPVEIYTLGIVAREVPDEYGFN